MYIEYYAEYLREMFYSTDLLSLQLVTLPLQIQHQKTADQYHH